MTIKIFCVSNKNIESQKIFDKLQNQYDLLSNPNNAEIIIVIGGDGTLLHALHDFMHFGIPFYGINTGSIGFLMNKPKEHIDLQNLKKTIVHPLIMEAYDDKNTKYHTVAINEIYIYRQTNQSAKFSIKINDIKRMNELVADGILVSTPAGSSAYNLSAGGSILPLEANLLCLTPICPFRPRRWNGALVNNDSKIEFEIIDSLARPVSVVADFQEFKNIKKVIIKEDNNKDITLLFNKDTLEDRLVKEQFWNL